MFKEKKAYAQARSTVAVNHILDVVTWDTNLLGKGVQALIKINTPQQLAKAMCGEALNTKARPEIVEQVEAVLRYMFVPAYGIEKKDIGKFSEHDEKSGLGKLTYRPGTQVYLHEGHACVVHWIKDVSNVMVPTACFDGDKFQRIDKSDIRNLVWIFDKTQGYATFTVEVE